MNPLILAILFCLLMAAVYFLHRNSWVCQQRINILLECKTLGDLDEYHKLAGYDAWLFLHPFCWNVEKLRTFKKKSIDITPNS